MNDRLTFTDDLRRELSAGRELLDRRRTKRRRAALAGGGLVVGALAIAAVFGFGGIDRLGDTDGAETQIEAIDDPQPLNEPDVADGTNGRSDEIADPGVNTGRWETVPSIIGGESQPSLFWTGEDVIIMRTENGGNDVVGERWNPETSKVSQIAASGLNWRAFPASAWTGSEVLIIGGSNGPGLNPIGAAYNPANDSWRKVADPPGPITADNRFGGPSAWIGDELLVWPAALAYNPGEDSWRELTPSPIPDRVDPISVLAGDRLIIWGGCEGTQCDDSSTGPRADGFSYDPTSDTWTELPASPLPPAVDAVAVWSGTEVLIAVTGQTPTEAAITAAYNPATDSWRVLSPWPQPPARYAAAAWTGEWFVVWGGGPGGSDTGVHTGAAYDPTSDRWLEIEAPAGTGRSFHSMIAADDLVYISATRTSSAPIVLREVSSGSSSGSNSVTDPSVAEPLLLALPRRTGDGAALYDVGLSTGERFRLTVPMPFADDLVLTENQAPDPITIDGGGGRIAITFEPCNAEDSDLLADPPVLVRCGPDQLLTLAVEPTIALTPSEVDQFELRLVSSGFRYGPVLVSAYPELSGCGNCSPWGPLAYPNSELVINKTTPSSAVAVDIDSLQEIWRTPPQQTSFALIAVDDGILLDLETGPLVKLDLDGQERWRIERGPDEDRLDVFGRFLLSSYTGTDNNQAPLLRRFDPRSGAVGWVSTGRVGADWQLGSPVNIDGVIVAADVADAGMTGPAATLQAFDVDTGETIWTTTLATNSRAEDGVVLDWFDFEDGPALVVKTSDGIVSRVEARTGRILWQTLVPLGRFNGTEFAPDGTLALDIDSPNGRRLLHPETGAMLAVGDENGGGVNDDRGGQAFTCPVTIPPATGFTPPEPWPATPSDAETIWFGSADLWTPLLRDGHRPRKSVWWSANFQGGSVEGQPAIEVVYRRLDLNLDPNSEPDTDTTVIFESPGTNAYTPEDRDFMINGIEPDDPGCWQATATYRGTSLNYVYEVG